ncbi:MAG TPA: Fe-S cluster assembly protein SufD [Stellaceae bacterium]|nr:Fe-S cluster assembly protein SufD [Stellaceae bacterium]
MSAIVDFPVKPEARPYLEAFEAEAEPRWLATARKQALSRFGELGFPTRKSESWRYLDLQPLARRPLLPGGAQHQPDLDAARAQLSRLSLPGSGLRLVLLDGLSVWDLSIIEESPGGDLWFGSVVSAYAEKEDLLPDVAHAVPGGPAHPFAALNEAFFADGYILEVRPGVVLDRPIEIIHLASGHDERSFHTRNLIALGPGSRASIVEIYAGDGRYWRNDVTAARLGEGAELRRTILVEESAAAVRLSHLDAKLAAGARLEAFALLLGGYRVREEANVQFEGEGASCDINGAFIAAGEDEANVVTAIDHAAPRCRTSELIKGVAAGRGHGAFQGRITVRKHAQQTDARQLSRNLILGRRAAIDTKPELEIDADDVKCSHGASVGDLDEAALFYLRARGISADEARRMLIEGFLSETVEAIGDPGVRDYLSRRLAMRLAALEG